MFLAWSDMQDPKNNLLPMALCFLFLFLFFFFTPLSQASGSSNLLLIHFLLCVCVCEGIFFTWSSQVKRKKKKNLYKRYSSESINRRAIARFRKTINVRRCYRFRLVKSGYLLKNCGVKIK